MPMASIKGPRLASLNSNLAPAAELGMATVQHVDAATTIDELEELLSVALR